MQFRSAACATQPKWLVLMGVLLAILTFASCAFAQGGNVAISGTVVDPAGALIAGAKVTVTQQSTANSRSTVTNASGQFNIPSLPPTTYTVTVEAAGFKKYVQDVVLLDVFFRSAADDEVHEF